MNTAGLHPGTPAGQLDAYEIRLLGEIGLLAVGAGNARAAEDIFSGLLVLRPDRTLPYIGLALAWQLKGDVEAAIRILSDEGARANPGSEEIQAFLGLVLENAGRPNAGRRAMRGILADSVQVCDSPVRRLARNFLAAAEGGCASADAPVPPLIVLSGPGALPGAHFY